MRLDDLVADARVGGERGGHDGPLAVRASSLIEHVSDGLGAERASHVRVADGQIERGCAVEIEETQET